jgi:galactose mutarotase-like enzyme
MIVLENEFLEAHLDPKGAEIAKLIGKQDGVNYMWKQDPVLWGHSAPVLFPIVGALKNGETVIEGKTYKMGQHGFSRNTEYTVEEQDGTHVVFHLFDTEETKTMYPYGFDLYVTYRLEGRELKAEFKVVNDKEDYIRFQIGGHPAFACPFLEGEDANDYYVEFEQKENVTRKVINPARGGMSHMELPFFENERRFFVRQALFDSDAIVLPHFKSECVTLKSLNHDKSLTMHMHNFDYVGIWASKHTGGLLAIEPWVGITDFVDASGQFEDREDMQTLKKGETFVCDFAVEIHQ